MFSEGEKETALETADNNMSRFKLVDKNPLHLHFLLFSLNF